MKDSLSMMQEKELFFLFDINFIIIVRVIYFQLRWVFEGGINFLIWNRPSDLYERAQSREHFVFDNNHLNFLSVSFSVFIFQELYLYREFEKFLAQNLHRVCSKQRKNMCGFNKVNILFEKQNFWLIFVGCKWFYKGNAAGQKMAGIWSIWKYFWSKF